MAGHEDAGVMTGHIGTNTPKIVPPRRGRPPFDPTQTGLCKFGWVWSTLIFSSESPRAVNSVQIVNSLRMLVLVCRGPLGNARGLAMDFPGVGKSQMGGGGGGAKRSV